MKSELTARYTNSEVKKVTLEKLNTLIADLLAMDASDVSRIAHNDAYFGLGGSMDTGARTEYMNQDVLMRSMDTDLNHGAAVNARQSHAHPPREMQGRLNESDGHEYLEHPTGSGAWYYRRSSNAEWNKWTQ